MSNDNSSGNQGHKTQIILALITLVGTLGAALGAPLIQNWDKFASSQQPISSSSPPSQPSIVFYLWGKETLLQSDTKVPAGLGRIRVKIHNLPSTDQEKLWFYVKSGGNNLYYLDRLIKSSEGVWETRGDQVQFGSVGNDGCLPYEAGIMIYDPPSATNEFDSGLQELPGSRLGEPVILIREPVGEQQC